MTDTLPADTLELETARGFDSARLIAEVRRGNEAAISEAYRQTFGSHVGRVVLLHALASIGEVGAPRGAETLAEASHKNGRGYAVLKIAGLAGFDPTAIAAAGLTQILEGADYEQGYGHDHGRSRPVVDWGDGRDGDGADRADGGFDLDDAGGGDFGSDA